MWLMFGLTNAHAAGALAIVTIGTAPGVGLMNDEVLGGTVMLILFSCLISGFATNRGAKGLALSDTALEDNRGSYHGKCLITYSQEDNVDVMTQLAILIRNPFIPDSLMGLHVAYDNGQQTTDNRRRTNLRTAGAPPRGSASEGAVYLRWQSNGKIRIKASDGRTLLFCGEDRIRTYEPLSAVTRFPGVPLQPLEHLSKIN